MMRLKIADFGLQIEAHNLKGLSSGLKDFTG